MILLEVLELESVGCADEIIFGGSDSDATSCELRNFNLAWKIPMNFTCVEGALEPAGEPEIR